MKIGVSLKTLWSIIFIISDEVFLDACFAKYFIRIAEARRLIFKWLFQLLFVKFKISSFSNKAALPQSL